MKEEVAMTSMTGDSISLQCFTILDDTGSRLQRLVGAFKMNLCTSLEIKPNSFIVVTCLVSIFGNGAFGVIAQAVVINQ